MAQKHTLEELNNCSREELITIVLMMQGQLDALNDNIEKLIEQVRIANNYRFGRHTESLKSIEGQLSFFDEADAAYDESSREPSAEEVITAKRLLASILNVKYVNSSALHRIEQEFQRNGVNISRQTMSNWIVRCSQMYFTPFVERMKQELLSLHVTQSDETPTQVIADSDPPNSKCYMWVHRSGEFYTRRPIVIYEYQKGRDHQKPLDFYKDYKGILVTDSLQFIMLTLS